MDESLREKKFVEGRDLALKAKEIDPDNPDVYVLWIYANPMVIRGGARMRRDTAFA